MAGQILVVGIVGSPRDKGNTEIMVAKALEGAASVPGVTTEIVTIARKKISPCLDCGQCHKKECTCVIKDDFQPIFDKFLRADGVIIGSPVYHMGVTAQLKALLDRLGNSLCATSKSCPSRPMKAGGAVAQGMNRFGGQEFTLQTILNSYLMLGSVAVAGDSPFSYIGAPGSTYGSDSRTAIAENDAAMDSARNVGIRVAEAAKIIRAGIDALKDEIPQEYRNRPNID